MALRVFPVASIGSPTFSDTFGAPRSGGRTHEGTDIFAAAGTPLNAVDDGALSFVQGSLGGNVARLIADDGTTYIYSHLQSFAGEQRRVRAGDVIGFVGTTGNAQGTPPHCHFEVHPKNSGPVNPFPLLRALKDGAPQPPIVATVKASQLVLVLLLAALLLAKGK